MSDMSPSDPKELLAAWKAEASPPEAVRARTWDAISARAAAGDLGPSLSPEPASAGMGAGVKLSLVLGGIGTSLGLLALAWLSLDGPPQNVGAEQPATVVVAQADAPAPEPPTPPSLEPAPELPPPAVPASAPAPAPETPAKPAASINKSRPRAKAPSPAEPAAAPTEPTVDPLAVEMQLLARARTALKRGDTAAALAVLDDHAKRFPKGALASERELSRVAALCRAQRLDQAETTAKRFIAAHPDSPLAKRLRQSCVGERL